VSKWRAVDFLLLAGVVAIAATTRLLDIGSPSGLIFDESYYAQDACTYLDLGKHVCGGISEASWVHPPLGKWIIALGIAIGGYHPAAWRAPAAITGILVVLVLYLLTRRLTGSTLAAVVAASVIALDPLSIVSSRVAMLDIFVTLAGILAVLFAVLHLDALARREEAGPRFFEPWLVAAGLCCGAAIATKWSGILVLGTVLALAGAWEIKARTRHETIAMALAAIAPTMIACFFLVPALVYLASYVGRLDGVLLAPPWQQDAWPRVFAGRELRMATFHVGLNETHPYASPAWSWLLGKRAVTYFFEVDAAGRYRHILAFANLAVWLPGLLAALWAIVTLIRRRMISRPEFVVVIAFAGAYLPWLLLTVGRPFVFLHYVLPTIPFLALALGWAISTLPRRIKIWSAASIMAVAVLVAAFWAPLMYGWPISYDDWRMRIVFSDCTPDQFVDNRLMPRPHPGPPPSGWCWV
jgi:dolichyl-phosphate-mannose-protein mannosyltransferase